MRRVVERFMSSKEQQAQRDPRDAQREDPRLRPLAKVDEPREQRISGDHIHLSPRAQRRMAMGRRSGY